MKTNRPLEQQGLIKWRSSYNTVSTWASRDGSICKVLEHFKINDDTKPESLLSMATDQSLKV